MKRIFCLIFIIFNLFFFVFLLYLFTILSDTILFLFSFLIINFFINLIYIAIYFLLSIDFLLKINLFYNQHKDGIVVSCNYIKNSKSPIEFLYLILFYIPYYLLDIFSSLPRIIPYICFKKKSLIEKGNIVVILIDSFILFLFFLGIFIYSVFDKNNNRYLIIFCSFFIWRITVICINKLKEIADIGIAELPIVSFPRTLLITIINFVELVIGFSYLNFYFGVTTFTNKFDIFIETMLIFTTMKFELNNACLSQKLIIFFEILAFIVFVVFFIANLADLRRKRN